MIDVSMTARKIINNVETVIVGKRQQLILSLVSWFCEGHILLEDVPGVAKTMLARALAAQRRLLRSSGSSARRTCCRPTSPARRSSTRRPSSSNSAPARFSRRSSWPTKSTARRRAPRRRCSKRWPNGA